MPSANRRPTSRKPPLTAERILVWADAFHAAAGRWPTRHDRRVGLAGTGETWSGLDACLKGGHRELPPGSSLALLLRDRRGRRHHSFPPTLSVPQVLAWADAHHARTGEWPGQADGPIPDAPGESWAAVEFALREGTRGLPGGSSVAQLLHAERGVRHHYASPPLVPETILAWADAHHARTGDWPGQASGPVADAPGENWAALDMGLRVGVRTLPGGSSLAQLLAAERGVRNGADRPPLAHWEILVWADAHHERTGDWPTAKSGPVADAPGETWAAVAAALEKGLRGLPGGDSLAKLLARRRGRPNSNDRPPLTPATILAWADAHHARTGRWPTRHSGAVADRAGETWSAVAAALANGRRGLPGGSSLAKLLSAERGVGDPARDPTPGRPRATLPPLTADIIVGWAEAHHARTGRWPTRGSGPIAEAGAGETWATVADAVVEGRRGLAAGGTLAQLLAERCGARNHMARPPLTARRILEWADAFHQAAGRWPSRADGAIFGTDGETWKAVEQALRQGLRGLPGGSSLAAFLAKRRGVRNRKALPRLKLAAVRRWAAAHAARTGSWPTGRSGPVAEAPGETWAAIDAALRQGIRGLPGGSSLFRLAPHDG